MGKSKHSPSGGAPSQAELDHRSKQLNANNEEYWKSRGHEERPEDWETVAPESKHPPKQGG